MILLKCRWAIAPVLLLPFLATPAVRGADVVIYLVAKGNNYNQNSSAPPVPKGSPARFNALVGLSATNSVTNATVQALPSGSIIPMLLQGGTASSPATFTLQAKYTSQSVLDAAYPNGNYQFVIDAVHDHTKTLTLALSGNAYPASAPYVTNPFESNVIFITNPAAPFTLTWNAFPGGTVNDFILVMLSDSQGNPIYQTPYPGQAGALKGTATSVVFPPNSLPAGSLIGVSLIFAKVVQTNLTAYPGVPGYAAYYTATSFGMVALAEDVAFYNISKHQVFTQSDTGPPALVGSSYRFVAQVIANASNTVTNAQVQPPAPAVLEPLSPDPTDTVFAYQKNFTSQAGLDAAFVTGAYAIQVNAVHDGSRVLPMTMPADAFPVAPHVSDWTATQGFNAAASLKLTWDPFTGAGAQDDIHVLAIDSLGNGVSDTLLSSSATNFVFPAGTFQNGQTYQAQVQFRHFATEDTITYPGATGAVRFISRTILNLTPGGGAPPSLAVVAANGAGSFQLVLSGQAGLLYAIDASTNLQAGSWVPLVTNTAVGGQFTFTDSQSSKLSARFYRGRTAN
jgi:hypothetical protein